MTEKPMIFKAAMVRAILEGRKTQTRHIIKPRNHPAIVFKMAANEIAGEINRGYYGNSDYKPGDHIWVRETNFDALAYMDSPLFKDGPRYHYRADENASIGCHKWRPSSSMPKSATRIWLEITSVRAEKLNNISEEDAIAEGIEPPQDFFGCPCWKDYSEAEGPEASVFPDDPISSFRTLWESTGGNWSTNPWVAVIEFRRINNVQVPLSQAVRDVISERYRQVVVEGWTPKHDNEHKLGELNLAAASYAAHAHTDLNGETPLFWPWDKKWWKPTTPRRDLVKAGALILAEIERLDRAATAQEVR